MYDHNGRWFAPDDGWKPSSRASLGSAADLDPDDPDFRAKLDAIRDARAPLGYRPDAPTRMVDDRLEGFAGGASEADHGPSVHAYRGSVSAPTPWKRAVIRNVLSTDLTVDAAILAVLYAFRLPRNRPAVWAAGVAMRQVRADRMVAAETPDTRKGRRVRGAADVRQGSPESRYELSTADVHDAILSDALEGLSEAEETLAISYVREGAHVASQRSLDCGWDAEYAVAVAAVEVARYAVMRELPNGSRMARNPRKAVGMAPRPRTTATEHPGPVMVSAGHLWIKRDDGSWLDAGEVS